MGISAGQAVCYLITIGCFSDWVKKKYSGNLYYELIKDAGKEDGPLLVALVRVMMIPAGIKNYLLPLVGLSFLKYMLYSSTESIFFSLVYVMLGTEIQNLLELVGDDSGNNKEEKNGSKMKELLLYVLLGLTITIMVFLIWYVKRRFEKMQLRIQEKRRNTTGDGEEGESIIGMELEGIEIK